jgi:hypothetical protein
MHAFDTNGHRRELAARLAPLLSESGSLSSLGR